jgi:site-specific recombinase XerD
LIVAGAALPPALQQSHDEDIAASGCQGTSYRPQMSITLEDFWNRHFEPTIAPMQKLSTQDLYRLLTTRHIVLAFRNLRLDEIYAVQVQQFVQRKQAQGYSPQTPAHLRNLLSKSFRRATSRGWIETNPAHGVELPPAEKRRKSRVLRLSDD